MAQKFDVVINGGAITGSVLALALSSFSSHQMQIAIIEKSPPNFAEQGGFDARSIALAYGTLQKFRKILPLARGNLLEKIEPISTPIEQIHVSDQGHFGKTTLSAAEMKLPYLGRVVELAKIGQELTACLAKQLNISLFCPNTIQQIERTPQICQLTLQDGTRLETPLLVCSDGIQSQIAKQCGVETRLLKDYQQSAIIANVKISEPHHQQAFERFTSQGPLALLPLADQTMSLVWCVKQAEDLLTLSETDFLAKLQQQFGWKLGKFERASQRFAYPLTSQKAEAHIHHRLAIVGNAAQLLHPVAGQGFNLGMRDLFALAQQVATAFQAGNDLGDYTLLSEFERHRKADQDRIIRSTSGLISLFGCEFLPVQALRNLGLLTLTHHTPTRKWLANQALGW
ncbi:2-octaprenyl-6-methoxyphenyl hydroxylase [Haemophilus paracuniculus]|uniref:2-octaprenyl-6-methoxyphenyl hydroxylase n=1 Tax=Haemophilus paracuniculus TaxID=734 RepID=A0A1T0AUI6_9PAST|nr:2-octaprenyl-6-methoxyphenyl hydroxylase [Haemophilus paracuniculus]OOS00254.1 2-octaprenyl-6-methoxyphenyl hydroxylase [Haemophilus paracuniculus]